MILIFFFPFANIVACNENIVGWLCSISTSVCYSLQLPGYVTYCSVVLNLVLYLCSLNIVSIIEYCVSA